MDLKIKKSLKKLFLVLLLISFQNITFSEESLYHEDKIVACSNFYDAVKKSENPRVKNLFPRFIYKDFGFYIKSTTNSCPIFAIMNLATQLQSLEDPRKI